MKKPPATFVADGSPHKIKITAHWPKTATLKALY